MKYYTVNQALDIFGIRKYTNKKDIKKRYLALSAQYHPDKFSGDTEKIKEINSAYEVLSTYQDPIHVSNNITFYKYEVPIEKIKEIHQTTINGITFDIPVIKSWKQIEYYRNNCALYIVAKQHKTVKRSENDLLIEYYISSIDAIIGKTIKITNIFNNIDVEVEISPLTTTNTVKEYKNLGIGTGSLFVKLVIDTPKLTKEQVEKIKQIFN